VLLVLNKVTTIIPGSNSVPLRAVAATTATPPLHVLNFVASSSATAGHSNLAKKEKEKEKKRKRLFALQRSKGSNLYRP